MLGRSSLGEGVFYGRGTGEDSGCVSVVSLVVFILHLCAFLDAVVKMLFRHPRASGRCLPLPLREMEQNRHRPSSRG